MLRITPCTSAAGASRYYTTADYYTEGQELEGRWRGEGARMLGLAGEISRDDWTALCNNLDPQTGKRLTARTKDNRRVGYDFNWHAPKSVSLLYSLTGDDRILDAFRDAVGSTMSEMEREMSTRVRRDGGGEDRTTGNMVWGEFVHTTSRPVDGVPDPHLHAHCFVMNATFDPAESRWKAGEFAGLKRDARYFEAKFHARLARRMEEMGLETQRTRTGWEIAGIEPSTLRAFSRRTALIEAKAAREGIRDPEERGKLGAGTREAKAEQLSLRELRSLWDARLAAEEREAIREVAPRIGGEALPVRDVAATAVELAESHCFERESLVPERRLAAESIRRAFGAVEPEAVERELAKRDLLRTVHRGRRVVTTREVLAEESRMLDFARDGRGAVAPFTRERHSFRRDWLGEGQRQAVEHILSSPDRVIVVRGAAGTGKTTMTKEAVEAIEASGTKVYLFAPSGDASRNTLRGEGFAEADTVARLLVDERMQDRARGGVLWIDEAGLIGTRTMGRVFSLADRLGARVVLVGDRRQHGAVERGAALRLLEDEAGLRPAQLKEIKRQSGEYRQAVEALAEGRVEDGFGQLDRLGWIREVEGTERDQELARSYVRSVESGKSALVVSPTHREGERVAEEIRTRLKELGIVGEDEREFPRLVSRHLTAADRADPTQRVAGDIAVYSQNAPGRRRGERVLVRDPSMDLPNPERFDLYRPETIRLAKGDLVRVTRGGMSADGQHRLESGATYRIAGFERSGDIRFENGWSVARDFGFLDQGYVVTSHASQGRTVDHVYIAQSSDSFGASSREQFYVSASRAKERATIFTDDRGTLMAAVRRSEDRLSATELFRPSRRKERMRGQTRRARIAQRSDAKRERPERERPERERKREGELDRVG